MEERILTVFLVQVMSFWPSSIFFMVFAASGAQEPFSMRPMVFFWKLRSVRWSMNVLMNGKMSAL